MHRADVAAGHDTLRHAQRLAGLVDQRCLQLLELLLQLLTLAILRLELLLMLAERVTQALLFTQLAGVCFALLRQSRGQLTCLFKLRQLLAAPGLAALHAFIGSLPGGSGLLNPG